MIKIFIDKRESAPSVIEKVIASPDSHIVVVVPKNAEITNVTANFGLLKREAESVGKDLFIESVDDEVLSLAEAEGITAMHPLFRNDQQSTEFSDIVAGSEYVDGALAVAGRRVPARGKKVGPVDKNVTPVSKLPPRRIPLEDTAEISRERFLASEPKISPKMWDMPMPQTKENITNEQQGGKWGRKLIIGGIIGIILLGGAWWAVGTFWSKAEVTLAYKKNAWAYEGKFTAKKSVTSVDIEKNIIPAELFTDKKNTVMLFPATGKKDSPQKATARIIIWNAYSEASQQLVATTRFEAPDGKIFRLSEAVTVPGAKKEGTTIVPSSAEASVIAAEAGPSYNVGPIAKLTIPGFKGTPRYEGFYGEMKEAAKGGSIGERAFPTDADISAAKVKVEEMLKTSLSGGIVSGIPSGFTVFEGASKVEILKITPDTAVDAQGKFSVFGEAQLIAVAIRDADIESVLYSLASKNDPSLKFWSVTVAHKEVVPDFREGIVSFSIGVNAETVKGFDVRSFTDNIVGKKVDEVKALVKDFDGSVEITLWPPYVTSRLPKDKDRISIKEI